MGNGRKNHDLSTAQPLNYQLDSRHSGGEGKAAGLVFNHHTTAEWVAISIDEQSRRRRGGSKHGPGVQRCVFPGSLYPS